MGGQDLDAHCLMSFTVASVDCSWKETSSEHTNGTVAMSLDWKEGVTEEWFEWFEVEGDGTTGSIIQRYISYPKLQPSHQWYAPHKGP